MSEALEYLMKARPAALKSYFQFLREAGRHLDPRTRAIISVITKVGTRTEAGFRQYLKRALEVGVSADEILDALLVAFPVLGLSKVTWAVDIILKMDLPQFKRQERAGCWHDVTAADALADGQTLRLSCEGRTLFVHRSGELLNVFDTRCPHRGTDMPASAVCGTRLVCPAHGWVFDLASGECLERGQRGLHRLPSRVDAGRLLAYW